MGEGNGNVEPRLDDDDGDNNGIDAFEGELLLLLLLLDILIVSAKAVAANVEDFVEEGEEIA